MPIQWTDPNMDSVEPTRPQQLRRKRHRLLVGTLLPLAVVSSALVVWLAVSTHSAAHIGPVAVEGNAQFIGRVGAALSLLEQKDPAAYRLVGQRVPRIIQGEHSGMWAYRDPPTLEIGPQTAGSTTTWLAGAIAHDAMHSRLYADWREAHNSPVPDTQWTGVEAERKCCQYQLEVLKRIGAPQREIDWCARQDGTFPDVTGDGKLGWDDYRERNW
jgi:hypothetical protein